MDKNILRQALWEFLRPLIQLISNILNPDGGEEWLTELKKFLRKEPCWVIPIHLLHRLLTDAKFNRVNHNITPTNFPEEPVRSNDYKVFDFGRHISSEEAVAAITKDGYLPTNIYEDLSWNGWNGTDTIVSLGSSCVVDGSRLVPFRIRFGAERNLDLDYWDGDCFDRSRFLAVRNPQS